MTTDPMDPKAAKLIVVSPICSRVVLLQLHLPLILCIIQNHFASSRLMLMMWDWLWPSFDTTAFHRIQLIIREVDQEIPFDTLELACPNGKFFALDDKFTSLAFDRVISWVFDFSSSIHILWIMLIVPWGPLSLSLVSIALVNSLHQYWLVIKRLSSMSNVNTFIHMLGSLLWSGLCWSARPWIQITKSLGCEVMWHGYDDMHVSFIWLAAIRPWAIICNPSHYWMVATIPWFRYDPLWLMVVPIPGSIT